MPVELELNGREVGVLAPVVEDRPRILRSKIQVRRIHHRTRHPKEASGKIPYLDM